MSKPTIATVKAFIRKNRAQLLVKCNSGFDAMVDGCTTNHGAAFTPAGDTHIAPEHTLENQRRLDSWPEPRLCAGI